MVQRQVSHRVKGIRVSQMTRKREVCLVWGRKEEEDRTRRKKTGTSVTRARENWRESAR